MLVSPQWPLLECQSFALISRDQSRYNLVPPRSAKFNSQRDNPQKIGTAATDVAVRARGRSSGTAMPPFGS
jgi:hypothetical protein